MAQRTGHDVAVQALNAAFLHPVGNQAMEAHRHFFGLREAEPRLRGFALFDLLKRGLPDLERLPAATWRRRVIENYLSSDATVLDWAAAPLTLSETHAVFSRRRQDVMGQAIQNVKEAAHLMRPDVDPAGPDANLSDKYLKAVFHQVSQLLGETNRMPKKRFHEIAAHVPDEDLAPEIEEKLDFIAGAHAGGAEPVEP